MEIIRFLIDFLLHIDKHLQQIVTDYQTWTYLILFVIIFCETGLGGHPVSSGRFTTFCCRNVCCHGIASAESLVIIDPVAYLPLHLPATTPIISLAGSWG